LRRGIELAKTSDHSVEGIAIFRRLIVLLDERSPFRGAFAYALEWAWHLRLPIHAWAFSTSVAAGSDEFATMVNSCAKVCRDWNLELRLRPLGGDPAVALRPHLEAEDLLVVGYLPEEAERIALIQQILQTTAAVLICPQEWKNTLSRMLLLYRHREQNEDALATVIDFCRCARATPVVLTVARSQRQGTRLQQPARAAFADRGQDGDFDLFIGTEVAEAAVHVARWRHCQLLVMGRYGRPPWARWLGGSTTERLIRLADSLPVLSVPKRHSLAAPAIDVQEMNDLSGRTDLRKPHAAGVNGCNG
jgi:nucleotide-binding universal stress UspA family protein